MAQRVNFSKKFASKFEFNLFNVLVIILRKQCYIIKTNTTKTDWLTEIYKIRLDYLTERYKTSIQHQIYCRLAVLHFVYDQRPKTYRNTHLLNNFRH